MTKRGRELRELRFVPTLEARCGVEIYLAIIILLAAALQNFDCRSTRAIPLSIAGSSSTTNTSSRLGKNNIPDVSAPQLESRQSLRTTIELV